MDVTRPPKAPSAVVQPHKTTATASVVQTHTTAETTKPLPLSSLSSEWTPSGADIARRQAPRDDLPVLDLVAARAAQRPPAFVDGKKWAAERLNEIARLTRVGVPVVVVFDLDNTVFDTRHRTLFALREFDRQNGTGHFDGVTVADCAVDGRATAQKLGLKDDVIEAAAAFWETSFWTPAHLAHDVAVADMVELVHRARAAGATVKFLTGRTAPFHDDSVAQLEKAGVDVDVNDVVCKPDLSVRTAPFKEQMMKQWAASSELGFFVTEGVRDLEHVQQALPELPLLRLGCSFEAGERVPKIPLWPAAF